MKNTSACKSGIENIINQYDIKNVAAQHIKGKPLPKITPKGAARILIQRRFLVEKDGRSKVYEIL